ncbi:hypothetical protein FisN_26Lh083 [Fistulifera solaris]|uniref:Peptidase C14 caspase domain-containing protein n=1 Tax=Fistulifera solaris TaxID=1519565 RepID=A0A1Z5KCJ1_FISSO|nr:hypothetical protein FisN_26Lh083 [Fistulifera solaris]|eukprot:GAX24014.1 hypothetical protein FisN_26Lh083 [Fistulifera solaris]
MISDREFDQRVKQVIRSHFNMISSSADHQQSEEAYHTGQFQLPNPAGKAGGACTSAFLQAMYQTGEGANWVETLQEMQNVLQGMGYAQTPQLTSSRLIDIQKPLQIVPPGSGRRRALLIGINYVGQEGQLTACHNDVHNIREFLTEVYGFKDSEMLILMDDARHHPPTRRNIEDAMIRLTRYSQPNDVAFVSFSGHGGNTRDTSGDEADGMDETLIPVDFKTQGHIVDDDILRLLVKPMMNDVHVTVLMDCCHSGTVFDLPYTFGANDTCVRRESGFNLDQVHESQLTVGSYHAPGTILSSWSLHGETKIPKEEKKSPKKSKKKKKAATFQPKKKKKDKTKVEENEQQEVGPKMVGGQAALPVRRASKKSAAPAPGDKKCAIM